MSRFDGKVALATGAHRVSVGGRRPVGRRGRGSTSVDMATDVERVARELGQRCVGAQADVSRESDVQGMIDTAVETFGRLDVLCNNGGVDNEPALMADCAVEEYDRVAAVNSRGAFRVNRICPEVIDMPMARTGLATRTLPEAASTLLARPGEPEEIAWAVAFLASDDGSFITGQHLRRTAD